MLKPDNALSENLIIFFPNTRKTEIVSKAEFDRF